MQSISPLSPRTRRSTPAASLGTSYSTLPWQRITIARRLGAQHGFAHRRPRLDHLVRCRSIRQGELLAYHWCQETFGRLERAALEWAQAAWAPHDTSPDRARRGDTPPQEVPGRQSYRRTRRRAVHHQVTAWAEHLEHDAAYVAADAVERQRDRPPAEGRAYRLRPSRSGVVDPARCTELAHERHLPLSPRGPDDRRAGAANRLEEECADTARRCGDYNHVVRGRGGDFENGHGGSSRSDHRYRLIGV